jgi:hypothetical protein
VPKTAYQTTTIEESHRSDDQKLQDNAQQSTSNNGGLLGSRGLISRFENPLSPTSAGGGTAKDSLSLASPTSPTSRTNRSQSQDPSRKSLTISNSLSSGAATATSNVLINGMASSTPFALKKDTKDNANLVTNSSEPSALKRVTILRTDRCRDTLTDTHTFDFVFSSSCTTSRNERPKTWHRKSNDWNATFRNETKSSRNS